MARLELDHDPITLSPQRSRSHLSEVLQLAVAHGFDQIDGHDHVVPASLWRFDCEVDRDTHPSGEALILPRLDLEVGTTSLVASCRSSGFVLAESCYPAAPGQPLSHFRQRFLSLWVRADETYLRLSLKPQHVPEKLVYVPTVVEGPPERSQVAQTIEMPAGEWTTFVIHRFDQVIAAFTMSGRTYDVDAAGFRPARVTHRYERVRRGIV